MTLAVDTEAVAAAASACPSVARMSGGAFGQVATYLPGRKVTGVRVKDGVLEVHVVARWGAVLPSLGDEVRAAVAPVAGTLPVSVYIEDIDEPEALVDTTQGTVVGVAP